MSDQTAPEPTMEEILASIRRIISEDEASPEADADAADYDDDDGDEGDYGDPIEEAMAAATEEPVASAAPQPEAEPEPAPEPEPAATAATEEPAAAPPPSFTRDEPLIGRAAESAAMSAFRELSAATTPAGKGRTLDDLAREMLGPMLREWLDQNLPRIVEAAVRDEVERISRSRVG